MASTIKMGGAETIYNQFMSHLPEYFSSDKYLVYVSETLDKPEIPNVEYVVNHITRGYKLLQYEGALLTAILILVGVHMVAEGHISQVVVFFVFLFGLSLDVLQITNLRCIINQDEDYFLF